MTIAQAIDQLKRDFGLSDRLLAGALSIFPAELERWRWRNTLPTLAAEDRLQHLIALRTRLRETFATEDIPHWMQRRNRYLKGRTPAEAMAEGRVDRVEGAIEVVDSGIFL